MKNMAILLFLILGFCVGCSDGPAQFPAPKGHVNDFADKLDAETEKSLEATLVAFKKKSSIEIAVVTTPSLYDLTVEEYTIQLAQKWGVGNKKKDNGIVFLVAPKEKKMRIEVGFGLEGRLTDLQAKRVIDDSINSFLKNKKHPDFKNAIICGVDGILKELGEKVTPLSAQVEEAKAGPGLVMILLIIGLFVILIILRVMIDDGGGGYSSRGRHSGGFYSGRSSSSSFGGFGGGGFGGGGASGGW